MSPTMTDVSGTNGTPADVTADAEASGGPSATAPETPEGSLDLVKDTPEDTRSTH